MPCSGKKVRIITFFKGVQETMLPENVCVKLFSVEGAAAFVIWE
jgi:hypothetical protein